MAHEDLTKFAASTETPVKNKTSKILSMDDAVDELDPLAVKDAWARGQLMHQLIKAHGPHYMHSEDCNRAQNVLEKYNNSGLKQICVGELGHRHPLSESLGWENGPGNIEVLFDRLTSDEKDEEELVEIARRQLKEALRGCGMPRITVMRERVNHHANEMQEGQ